MIVLTNFNILLQPTRENAITGNYFRIRCTLFPTTLAANHSYEALSYCCEPAFPKQKIICNDKKLEIGIHLFQALEALQPNAEDLPRLVWIDAICI